MFNIYVIKRKKETRGIDRKLYYKLIIYTLKKSSNGKGIRWMPWHSEAKKDVVHCEKVWGVVNKL